MNITLSHLVKVVLVGLFLSYNLMAQLDYGDLEIFMKNSNEEPATIHDQTQSIVWDEDRNLTSNYQSGSFTIPEQYYEDEYGFNYNVHSGPGCSGCEQYADLGFGLYKIWEGDGSDYFYLDLRDANMGSPVDIYLQWTGFRLPLEVYRYL